ncbi:MAG: tripartite tricarboxylate transporter substrate binding protein [Acetobacteraceae bacterium]|nr:tripartite tricarboxylate transporter substrate binding protein [Acetobacteraceae bacterium]
MTMRTKPGLARRGLLGAGALVALPLPGLAQTAAWPTRPITIIVPFPPGGSTDNVARPIQMPLGAALGQNIVIENRGGAGATIGIGAVAQARADGHTLLIYASAGMTISPHLMRLPYDVTRDFTQIALLAISEGVVALNPKVPARTIQELVAYGRANPGALRFGSAGNGTITQMTGEIFAHAAGIRMEHVPYRGSAPALTALLSGDIEMQFDPIAIPAIKDGRLRGIATTGANRSQELPDLPTLRELGFWVEGGGGEAWFGMAGPAGLPPDVVQRLVAALPGILALPEVVRAMAPVGLRPVFEPPDVFARRIATDRALFGDAVKRTGATAQ